MSLRSLTLAALATIVAAPPAAWAAHDAPGQVRPFLFACGRYTANWAGRPRSYDQQCWDHMVNIGATMTGAGLCWCDAEPVRGQYNWDAIDYADFEVNEILARGMEPTFFLGLTPQWAALRPDLPPHRTPAKEEYLDDFMNFHRFVANRYKGRVKYYFFWNEPNGCSWINDGCANGDSYPLYTQWLVRCSQAVKSVDPDAKIIAGNLDYHAGVSAGYEYVQGMYDHGAGPYIDGIAIHPYDWNGTIHWQAVTDTRNVMVANGDEGKGLWLTEYGWNSGSQEDLANRLTSVLTELKKPEWSFVVQASHLVLNDGSGVENYGLMDADLSPRARYYAFRDFDKTWAAASTPGSLISGWNLVSLPLNPADPSPPEVFRDGTGVPIPISGNLHRHDHDSGSYLTYSDLNPSEFGDTQGGQGYWLYLFGTTEISYAGLAYADPDFSLPTAGWYLIGCPTAGAVPLSDVRVTNEQDGRTVSLHDAIYAEQWVDGKLLYYSTAAARYATCGFDPWCDSSVLAPWRGYWLHSLQDNLRLRLD